MSLERQASSIFSVCESPRHPNWMWFYGEDKKLYPFTDGPIATRRQDLPKVYTVNGALYIAKTKWLKQNQSFHALETLGYLMPAERSTDIDTPLDLEFANWLVERQRSSLT